ncbi:MAG: hypothetical protein NZ736_00020 [Candidatus Poseidoniaceae archaeon]|nr:hypothetical protein [Candidatus Poseidoniaceae archaeon]
MTSLGDSSNPSGEEVVESDGYRRDIKPNTAHSIYGLLILLTIVIWLTVGAEFSEKRLEVLNENIDCDLADGRNGEQVKWSERDECLRSINTKAGPPEPNDGGMTYGYYLAGAFMIPVTLLFIYAGYERQPIWVTWQETHGHNPIWRKSPKIAYFKRPPILLLLAYLSAIALVIALSQLHMNQFENAVKNADLYPTDDDYDISEIDDSLYLGEGDVVIRISLFLGFYYAATKLPLYFMALGHIPEEEETLDLESARVALEEISAYSSSNKQELQRIEDKLQLVADSETKVSKLNNDITTYRNRIKQLELIEANLTLEIENSKPQQGHVVNIADSAVAGDVIVGTKIDTQIINTVDTDKLILAMTKMLKDHKKSK